jgi:16S rRNA (cytosine1402-N4)-methyltransferase
MVHFPVLQKEILDCFNPKPNENFIDCTVDGGGHTLAILERNLPKGKVLGIDADAEMIKNLMTEVTPEFKKRLVLTCDNFANLKEIVAREKFGPVAGILLDLGMSSWHLEKSGRGFSFLKNEPLDMRYDSKNPLTAEKIVNFWSESDLEKILREYGEEKFSKKIAVSIVRERKTAAIKTTFRLVTIIKNALPSAQRHQKIHCATRTFQALRIAVNSELDNLKKVLPQAMEILRPEGKLLVISFHSLEDGIVKRFFAGLAENGNGITILTKKPIIPSNKEIIINPRSRSAKLRMAQKTCLKQSQ